MFFKFTDDNGNGFCIDMDRMQNVRTYKAELSAGVFYVVSVELLGGSNTRIYEAMYSDKSAATALFDELCSQLDACDKTPTPLASVKKQSVVYVTGDLNGEPTS